MGLPVHETTATNTQEIAKSNIVKGPYRVRPYKRRRAILALQNDDDLSDDGDFVDTGPVINKTEWGNLSIQFENISSHSRFHIEEHLTSDVRSLDIQYGPNNIDFDSISIICGAIESSRPLESVSIQSNHVLEEIPMKMLLSAYIKRSETERFSSHGSLTLDFTGVSLAAGNFFHTSFRKITCIKKLIWKHIQEPVIWTDIIIGSGWNRDLRKLKFDSVKFIPSCNYSLGNLLEENDTLESLYLCRTDLNNVDFHYFSNGLKHNSTLRKLKLHETGIGTKELHLIGKDLSSNYRSSLQQIYLSNNKIDPDVMEYIDAINHKCRIKRIERFAAKGYPCVLDYFRKKFNPSDTEKDQFMTEPLYENTDSEEDDSDRSSLGLDNIPGNQLDYFEIVGSPDSDATMY